MPSTSKAQQQEIRAFLEPERNARTFQRRRK